MKIWAAQNSWISKRAHKNASALDKDKITRIAVIKHAALGDMLQVRPMLITLREAFPNAKITLSVVTNYMKGIPEDLIDRLHVAKGNDKKYSVKEAVKSYKELGYQDIIFDISETTRSLWISKLNPAALKIGFMHKSLHRFIFDIAIPRAYYRFEAETFLEQVNTIGLQYEWPLRYDYSVPDRVYKNPYIVYFPTASSPDRCWPQEYMAELIADMCKKYPSIDHLLLAGLAEWESVTAKSIAKKIGPHENFKVLEAGPDDFSLVCHAETIVINDTGFRHLAIVAGTPTVCIFPISPNVFGYSPLFGNHKAVVADETGPASVAKVAKAIDEIINTNK